MSKWNECQLLSKNDNNVIWNSNVCNNENEVCVIGNDNGMWP